LRGKKVWSKKYAAIRTPKTQTLFDYPPQNKELIDVLSAFCHFTWLNSTRYGKTIANAQAVLHLDGAFVYNCTVVSPTSPITHTCGAACKALGFPSLSSAANDVPSSLTSSICGWTPVDV